jgi:cytochrome c oxidase assembly protein subunit 15
VRPPILPKARVNRTFLGIAFAFAAIVVIASSWLRLAANGLGCEPWPRCYGQPQTAAALQQQPATAIVRATHRVAASAFGLVALVLVVSGWRRSSRAQRNVGIALLALTLLLAWVGRYTPSPWPVVTLLNALGGFGLLALVAALAQAPAAHAQTVSAPTRAPFGSARAGLLVLIVAILLQSASGTMISVRLAGAACFDGVTGWWVRGASALFDPTRAGSVSDLVNHPCAGQPLELLHRLFGMALLIGAMAIAFVPRMRGGATTIHAVAALGVVVLFGIVTALGDGPALAGATHAMLAGVALAACSTALVRAAPCPEGGST